MVGNRFEQGLRFRPDDLSSSTTSSNTLKDFETGYEALSRGETLNEITYLTHQADAQHPKVIKETALGNLPSGTRVFEPGPGPVGLAPRILSANRGRDISITVAESNSDFVQEFRRNLAQYEARDGVPAGTYTQSVLIEEGKLDDGFLKKAAVTVPGGPGEDPVYREIKDKPIPLGPNGEQYDVVAESAFFNYVNPEVFLREMDAALKPGGIIVSHQVAGIEDPSNPDRIFEAAEGVIASVPHSDFQFIERLLVHTMKNAWRSNFDIHKDVRKVLIDELKYTEVSRVLLKSPMGLQTPEAAKTFLFLMGRILSVLNPIAKTYEKMPRPEFAEGKDITYQGLMDMWRNVCADFMARKINVPMSLNMLAMTWQKPKA